MEVESGKGKLYPPELGAFPGGKALVHYDPAKPKRMEIRGYERDGAFVYLMMGVVFIFCLLITASGRSQRPQLLGQIRRSGALWPLARAVDDHAMAMLETILATVTGQGGAGLGAAGALVMQRAKRRDDAAAAERDAWRAGEELTLEIIATARAAAKAWLSTSERVIDDLRHGRAVDVDRYDEQTEAASTEFISALYRLAGRRLPDTRLTGSSTTPVGPFDSRPLADMLSETSHRIRNTLHRSAEAPIPDPELDDTLSQTQTAYWNINTFLIRNTEALTGQLFPPPMMYEPSFRGPEGDRA
ncbi:hypothetical protein ACGFMM_32520 [Streptomyces sp. NPDC048604]|uniref:hypothetical protein n=1 Tax=Streptomyces sp. NPDC048604 TaxID=3365578 RepID=UPI0037137BC9